MLVTNVVAIQQNGPEAVCQAALQARATHAPCVSTLRTDHLGQQPAVHGRTHLACIRWCIQYHCLVVTFLPLMMLLLLLPVLLLLCLWFL